MGKVNSSQPTPALDMAHKDSAGAYGIKLSDVQGDAIAALEWGSCDGCGQHHECTVCGAPRVDWNQGDYPVPGQHKPDCPVPALIAKLKS